jgi:nitroreductase
MKTLDTIIADRRSVRSYLDRPVEPEKIKRAVEAARLAPSACNVQPWRFIAVTDPVLRQRIVKEGLGIVVSNPWAATAPVIMVACSDRHLLTHHIAERIQGVQYHLIDMGIALEHLVLKATELGLGTCYIGWFRGKNIKRILQLPSSWNVECLVTLGYSREAPAGPSPRKALDDILLIK